MKPSECVRLLKNEGFGLVKDGRKHMIWRKGDTTIIVSHGTRMSHHCMYSVLSRVRKARTPEA